MNLQKHMLLDEDGKRYAPRRGESPAVPRQGMQSGKRTRLIIKDGRIVAFVLLFGSFILYYIFTRMMEQGKAFKIRRLAPLEAMPEAVGRCAEMGKPIYYMPGIGTSLSLISGAYTLAGITILGRLASFAAKAGVRIRLFTVTIDAMPLIQETLKNAYAAEGRTEMYSDDDIELIANQSSLVSRYIGAVQREKPAAACLIGYLAYESVVLAEAGNLIGALQISGTVNLYQIPFLVASTDYTLIMEEVFAAAAAVSGDAGAVGPIAAEDMTKLVSLGIMILGMILAPLGIKFLVELLRM